MTTSIRQLETAQALAQAFGHHWGDFPLETLEAATDSQVVGEAIIRWCKTDRPDWPGLTPVWDADGDIVHATGSGRLSWTVDIAGGATINVWRPGDECAISVRVEYGTVDIARLDVFGCARLRHWTALVDALSALVGTDYLPACPSKILAAEARDLAEAMARTMADISRLGAAGGLKALADALAAREVTPEMESGLAVFGQASDMVEARQ
jgi:hypothetical protein